MVYYQPQRLMNYERGEVGPLFSSYEGAARWVLSQVGGTIYQSPEYGWSIERVEVIEE